MEFNLTLGMDNAAFEAPGPELARILRDIAERVDGFTFSAPCAGVKYPIRDMNGNRIGQFFYTLENEGDEN